MGELPAITDITFNVVETEKTDGISRLLTESLKVAQQGIGEGISRGIWVSCSTEVDIAIVGIWPRVLVLAVAGVHDAKFERMASHLPGKVIRRRDVGDGRQQREKWTSKLRGCGRGIGAPNSGKGHMRNHVW